MNKKITVQTAQILMEIMAHRCQDCKHENICIVLMKENCARQILKDQKIIIE
jgi:hypothetical protein